MSCIFTSHFMSNISLSLHVMHFHLLFHVKHFPLASCHALPLISPHHALLPLVLCHTSPSCSISHTSPSCFISHTFSSPSILNQKQNTSESEMKLERIKNKMLVNWEWNSSESKTKCEHIRNETWANFNIPRDGGMSPLRLLASWSIWRASSFPNVGVFGYIKQHNSKCSPLKEGQDCQQYQFLLLLQEIWYFVLYWGYYLILFTFWYKTTSFNDCILLIWFDSTESWPWLIFLGCNN